MVLFLLSYLGGVLTILSPCILPVLPFVFARSGEPFRRSGLPLLVGMAVTFAVIASIATVGGSWVVEANQYGRIAAMILLALFGLTLLSENLATRISQPFVQLGSRLTDRVDRSGAIGEDDAGRGQVGRSFVLGVATGLLWAPCAGPILGLILTGAALQGANVHSAGLLLAYAAGAATALGIALKAGGGVFALLKRSLGAEVWLRRGLGVLVLAGVAVISLGLDRGVLTNISLANTNKIEQWLVDKFPGHQMAMLPVQNSVTMTGSNTMNGTNAMTGSNTMAGSNSMNGSMTGSMTGAANTAAAPAPAADPADIALLNFSGGITWLNSPPLNAQALRGKVVLVDFWTYSCINCLRTLPYLRAWADRYKDQGLVIIGVHSPEFAFERDEGNVRKAIKDLSISYPVVIDNDYAIWQAYQNQYWPAHYLFDATGKMRYDHAGEGDYTETEQQIQQLLREKAGQPVASAPAPANTMAADAVQAQGAQLGSDDKDLQSGETYLGYMRAQNFASPNAAGKVDLVADKVSQYGWPTQFLLNQWGLAGDWKVTGELAQLTGATGRIGFKFHARDLHMVLGPDADGKPVRFRITVDGAAPGDNHGVDTDAAGNGTVDSQRLYQLVRQKDASKDHLFEIDFLDPGVQAYTFTFG